MPLVPAKNLLKMVVLFFVCELAFSNSRSPNCLVSEVIPSDRPVIYK